jgi:rsbT antagonist protein RsbS
MAVPILKAGGVLIASVQSTLTDAEWTRLRDELADRVGRQRCRGVVIDVTVLEVMDSFAARVLRTTAAVLQLRGAATVLVGIQPEVAFSMVQLGLDLRGVETALDLEEGLELLRGRAGAGTPG